MNSTNIEKKVLFLTTLPPPYHGASLSSAMCLDILKNDKRIDVKNVKLNYSLKTSDLGKVSLNKLYGTLQIFKEIQSLIKNFTPDIIYFAPAVTGIALYRDFLLLKIIKYVNKKKIILHIRGQFKEKEWNNPVTKVIIKSVLRCNKAIVLGPELIGNLRGAIPLNNIYILPNALLETLSEVEFQNNIKENDLKDDLNLLFISNMEEFKGWRKVLETCKLLTNIKIKYTCNFIGAWPSKREKRDFYKYVENNSLQECVIHHGQLLNNEKNKILKESDIMIFPTSYDACPRVVIEAMEFGLPVISNNVGTIPSLIDHNKTGFVLKKNNAEEILRYILKLRDVNFRKTMGIKGRERFLERFTLNKYKDNFLAIFHDADTIA